METKLLDGKLHSKSIQLELKRDIGKLTSKRGYAPTLSVVLVGDNAASEVYVERKKKACCTAGIDLNLIRFSSHANEEQLLEKIEELNQNSLVDAILVQLPLPKHIDEERILTSVRPSKDVDGFHPLNLGSLVVGAEKIIPCTTRGILELLERENISLSGKNVVVIGRSNIVGKPTALCFLKRDASITVVHGKTKNVESYTRNADIIVVAVGKPKFLKAEMVKSGAVIIDVGINRLHGEIVGDVDYDNLNGVASYITPVPGGVGPMTIAMLLKNTIKLAVQPVD